MGRGGVAVGSVPRRSRVECYFKPLRSNPGPVTLLTHNAM